MKPTILKASMAVVNSSGSSALDRSAPAEKERYLTVPHGFQLDKKLLKEGYHVQVPRVVSAEDCAESGGHHVDHKNFFKYFETIRHHYMVDHVGFHLKPKKVGSLLGHISCKYIRPLSEGEELVLGAKTTLLKKDRFTCEHIVYSRTHSQVCAVGRSMVRAFDYELGKPCGLDEQWIRNIVNIEGPHVIVHDFEDEAARRKREAEKKGAGGGEGQKGSGESDDGVSVASTIRPSVPSGAAKSKL